MLWLSDITGSTTDYRTLEAKNRESVQARVAQIRQEIKEGKRHRVGSPEWMAEAGLVYDEDGVNVSRFDEINQAVNQAFEAEDSVESTFEEGEASLEDKYKPGRGKSLVDISYEEHEPMQWVVPGLIAEGLGLLISPPKVGKSFFVLDLTVSVAAGIPVCGDIEVDRRPVLYMALEDGERRIHDRLKALGKRVDGITEVHTEVEREHAVGVVEDFVARYPKALVIIDTLVMVMPDKKNNVTQYQHDHRAISEYQTIAKRNPGSCILIVHHTRKMKTDDWMDSTSGTQGINGAADFVMALTGKRGAGVAQLQVTGREVEDHAVTLKRDDNGFWLHDENAMMGPTPNEELSPKEKEIVEALMMSDGGLKPKELQDFLQWKNYNQVTNYLARLMKSEQVRKSSGGRYVAVDDVS